MDKIGAEGEHTQINVIALIRWTQRKRNRNDRGRVPVILAPQNGLLPRRTECIANGLLQTMPYIFVPKRREKKGKPKICQSLSLRVSMRGIRSRFCPMISTIPSLNLRSQKKVCIGLQFCHSNAMLTADCWNVHRFIILTFQFQFRRIQFCWLNFLALLSINVSAYRVVPDPKHSPVFKYMSSE